MDILEKAVGILEDLHKSELTKEEIKEVIIRMWLEHTDDPLSISDINPTNHWGDYWKKPEQNLSTYMKMYKVVDDTQDTYDVKGRIKALDKLIDNALEARDRKAFTKYTRERNMLKLEL
jgi:hypothetical protein